MFFSLGVVSRKPARRGGDLLLHFGIYAMNFGPTTLAWFEI